jgi:multisubunit Na+/H+ antiporter MnhB subunit
MLLGDQIFGNGDQYTEFFHVSKYIVNSVIAASEVFFLSSIKRQEPVNGHLAGLTGVSALYIVWAYIGHGFTDEYAYYFLDPTQVGGKEKVAAAIVAFCGLTSIGQCLVVSVTFSC